MLKPTADELTAILAKHAKYLRGVDGGKCADLRRASLQGADLQGADLREADLRKADLRGADENRTHPPALYVEYFSERLDDSGEWIREEA